MNSREVPEENQMKPLLYVQVHLMTYMTTFNIDRVQLRSKWKGWVIKVEGGEIVLRNLDLVS